MRRLLSHVISSLIFILVLTFSTGCAYSKVVVPLDTDVDQTVLGQKTGRSSSRSILYLVAWGDSGVKAAAEQGGLTRVNHLDIEYYTILFGLYSKVTTIAYGD